MKEVVKVNKYVKRDKHSRNLRAMKKAVSVITGVAMVFAGMFIGAYTNFNSEVYATDVNTPVLTVGQSADIGLNRDLNVTVKGKYKVTLCAQKGGDGGGAWHDKAVYDPNKHFVVDYSKAGGKAGLGAVGEFETVLLAGDVINASSIPGTLGGPGYSFTDWGGKNDNVEHGHGHNGAGGNGGSGLKLTQNGSYLASVEGGYGGGGAVAGYYNTESTGGNGGFEAASGAKQACPINGIGSPGIGNRNRESGNPTDGSNGIRYFVDGFRATNTVYIGSTGTQCRCTLTLLEDLRDEVTIMSDTIEVSYKTPIEDVLPILPTNCKIVTPEGNQYIIPATNWQCATYISTKPAIYKFEGDFDFSKFPTTVKQNASMAAIVNVKVSEPVGGMASVELVDAVNNVASAINKNGVSAPTITVVKGREYKGLLPQWDDIKSGSYLELTVKNDVVGDGYIELSGTFNKAGEFPFVVSEHLFIINVIEEPNSSNVKVVLN